ncbi:MAG: deoxyribodipyrimidine photolyase [Crocinitomicaceae bacterium]|nr:deoxyribodipyrimidine photolyase [Crocinitomicaceae bacterium]
MELFENQNHMFPADYAAIMQRIRNINPLKYSSTRNYINGAVTYLSPYISRGIISTRFVLGEVLKKGYNPADIEKFIQELAWRDYWQQIWITKGNAINKDLKTEQKPIANRDIPKVIINSNTGIIAIDEAIKAFYDTGYLHNHVRMYIAAISCNMAHCHWKMPAKWMYYHLLDADWASNALSWQWVAGTYSNKKYVANQENINKYCFTKQKGTFLDIPYEGFKAYQSPKVLQESIKLELKTPLPNVKPIHVDQTIPTCLYNFYNLDPNWKKDISANRILLLEPSHFKSYPVSQKSIDFIVQFSELNIDNIQVYVGEFSELISDFKHKNIYYKEHPLNAHYEGHEEPRESLCNVQGDYTSFFSFWKNCKKQLKY